MFCSRWRGPENRAACKGATGEQCFPAPLPTPALPALDWRDVADKSKCKPSGMCSRGSPLQTVPPPKSSLMSLAVPACPFPGVPWQLAAVQGGCCHPLLLRAAQSSWLPTRPCKTGRRGLFRPRVSPSAFFSPCSGNAAPQFALA